MCACYDLLLWVWTYTCYDTCVTVRGQLSVFSIYHVGPGSGLAAGKSHLTSTEGWRQEDWGFKVVARLGSLRPCFRNRVEEPEKWEVCVSV